MAGTPEGAGHLLLAIEIKPDYGEAIHHLGALLADMGRTEEGLVYLEKAFLP